MRYKKFIEAMIDNGGNCLDLHNDKFYDNPYSNVHEWCIKCCPVRRYNSNENFKCFPDDALIAVKRYIVDDIIDREFEEQDDT